jgi:hypothetical protein
MKVEILSQWFMTHTYTILPTIIYWKNDLTSADMGIHRFIGIQWWSSTIGLNFRTNK